MRKSADVPDRRIERMLLRWLPPVALNDETCVVVSRLVKPLLPPETEAIGFGRSAPRGTNRTANWRVTPCEGIDNAPGRHIAASPFAASQDFANSSGAGPPAGAGRGLRNIGGRL
jgi:hypothetical protein